MNWFKNYVGCYEIDRIYYFLIKYYVKVLRRKVDIIKGYWEEGNLF